MLHFFLLVGKFRQIFTYGLKCLFLSICVLSAHAYAESVQPETLTKVYKIVGPDGQVSFSDQPNAASETLLIAPIPTVPALKPSESSPDKQQAIQYEDKTTHYSTLSIMAPANGSAFYSGSGEVDVIIDVQPALVNDDQLQLFLDNKLIKQDQQLQTKLQTVSRGAHELKAKLISASGKVLKESSSSFTVHRPSIQ